MEGVIYTIRNLANGKFYVGSTKRPINRKTRHWSTLRSNCHHNKHLQNAWNKYGETNFVFSIEEEVPDGADLLAIENMWLVQHVGRDNCYNIARDSTAPTRGCFGALNPMWGKTFRHSDTAKARISANHHMHTEEGRAAKSAQMKGRAQPKSEDTKKKIAATMRFIYRSIENHPRYGKQHTDETKAKISASRKGKAAGAEHYRYGQTVSEEVRKKIGDKQRGVPKAPRVLTEEGRAKIRAAADAGHYSHWTGKTHTEEAKQKLRKRVLEVTTNTEFDSLTSVLAYYGMHMPTLHRALNSNKPISGGKFKGLEFRYIP